VAPRWIVQQGDQDHDSSKVADENKQGVGWGRVKGTGCRKCLTTKTTNFPI